MTIDREKLLYALLANPAVWRRITPKSGSYSPEQIRNAVEIAVEMAKVVDEELNPLQFAGRRGTR